MALQPSSKQPFNQRISRKLQMYLGHYFFGISIFVTSVFLVLLVLVQRGRGGGLVGALGGPGGQSALGTKAGDVFTRITIVVAGIWIFLCASAVRTLNPSNSDAPSGLRSVSATMGGDAGKADAGKADASKGGDALLLQRWCTERCWGWPGFQPICRAAHHGITPPSPTPPTTPPTTPPATTPATPPATTPTTPPALRPRPSRPRLQPRRHHRQQSPSQLKRPLRLK